jgi:hypothetical protein
LIYWNHGSLALKIEVVGERQVPMSTAELVAEIKRLSNAERLKVIEATTALVREDLIAQASHPREERANRMRAAALQAKLLYEPGGEMTEWTAIDGEEVLDDSTIKG